MIARADRNGYRVTVTGLGACAPERVLTNHDLARMVDTTDEWIVERTGIRERRIAAPEEALSDLCLPAARQALARAGADASTVDLIIVATVTPDMAFPSTAAIIADQLGARDAAAYDLSAGCTGFMYALAQAHGMLAAGAARRALIVGGDILSRILDWEDRRTCIVFGDGAGAAMLERTGERGFIGFELGADGSGGSQLYLPAGGSRAPTSAETVAQRLHFVQMNGREVFKFATRILVSSAESLLSACGRGVEDVDVYVPHQANQRIIEYASKKLGVSDDRIVVNVDRFGNTSSGSIPLALADADAQGRLEPGKLVLMTGMGAGLTWGSSLIEWTASSARGDGRGHGEDGRDEVG
ncbi:MAG: ketoacyl-ACP synthase III [Actinomycetota bacterium]|nr:ketoacyl-ACP synthase III [Actinomycetota bacterium]